jgi:hypothetical protein
MFMPIRFAAVTFLISVASPHVSLAQVAETLPLGISPAEDSSALKAVRKGSDAAESVWVSGRFYSAFLGSASIGAAVKLYSFDQDMKFGSIFLGGVGVALLVGRPRSIVPPPEADAVNGSLPDAPGLSTLLPVARTAQTRRRLGHIYRNDIWNISDVFDSLATARDLAAAPRSIWMPEKTHHIDRALRDTDSCILERFDFLRSGTRRSRDNRARMPHPATGRSCLTRDESNNRLRHFLLHELRGVLLVGAANLANHHNCFGIRISLECSETVDEIRSVDRVAPDSNARCLTHSRPGHLKNDLVGKGARAAHQSNRSPRADAAGNDSNFRLAR